MLRQAPTILGQLRFGPAFWGFRVGPSCTVPPHDPDSAQIRRENMQQSETNKQRAAKSLAKLPS